MTFHHKSPADIQFRTINYKSQYSPAVCIGLNSRLHYSLSMNTARRLPAWSQKEQDIFPGPAPVQAMLRVYDLELTQILGKPSWTVGIFNILRKDGKHISGGRNRKVEARDKSGEGTGDYLEIRRYCCIAHLNQAHYPHANYPQVDIALTRLHCSVFGGSFDWRSTWTAVFRVRFSIFSR